MFAIDQANTNSRTGNAAAAIAAAAYGAGHIMLHMHTKSVARLNGVVWLTTDVTAGQLAAITLPASGEQENAEQRESEREKERERERVRE